MGINYAVQARPQEMGTRSIRLVWGGARHICVFTRMLINIHIFNNTQTILIYSQG